MAQRTPIEKRVAERVRALREERGLAQADLARLAKTSRSQVAAVEQGERAPSVVTLDSFARALRVPLWSLLDDGKLTPTPGIDNADQLAAKVRARGPEYIAAVEEMLVVLDRFLRRAAAASTKRVRK